jgi:hypothetical protein
MFSRTASCPLNYISTFLLHINLCNILLFGQDIISLNNKFYTYIKWELKNKHILLWWHLKNLLGLIFVITVLFVNTGIQYYKSVSITQKTYTNILLIHFIWILPLHMWSYLLNQTCYNLVGVLLFISFILNRDYQKYVLVARNITQIYFKPHVIYRWIYFGVHTGIRKCKFDGSNQQNIITDSTGYIEGISLGIL